MADLKYIEQISKGCTVTYGNRSYRVQQEKKYLFIIVFENGQRRKIDIKDLGCWWEYGSKADWVFNEWYKIYPDYQTFHSFAVNEKNATN
jgi:hypothetical protein